MILNLIPEIAFAWSVTTAGPTTLPEVPRGTFVVAGDRPELWISGATDAIRIDPLTGSVVDRHPGRWSGAIDAGGARIWCGDTGVIGPESTLVAEPCTGIAVLDPGFVATTPTGIWRWTEPNATPTHHPVALSPRPYLATDGKFSAAIAADGSTLIEWDGQRESQIATGGRVEALASGPRGWTWVIPAQGGMGDVTRRPLRARDRVVAITRGRFDGDGARDLLVVHDTGLGLFGGDSTLELFDDLTAFVGRRFGSSTSQSWSSTPTAILDAVPMDINGDGCDEVVVLTATTMLVRGSELCGSSGSRDRGQLPLPTAEGSVRPISPSPTTVTAPEKPVVQVGALELGRFVGMAESDYPAWSAEVGAGWAFAGSVAHANLLLPTFPALSAGVAYGGRTVRASFGIDSAGLLLWTIGDRIGIHFAMFTAGIELGDESLSVGPFATAGLWGVGGGVRMLVLPAIYEDHRTGVEIRMTWFHPGVGELLVLYTSRGRISAGDALPTALLESPRFACHRFGVGVGVAAGAGSTANSWEFVGTNTEFAFAASPVVTGQCGLGEGPVRGLVGVTAAPLFYYFLPYDTESRKVHHLASATFGAEIGSDAVRIGPIVDVGLFVASAGIRTAITPVVDRRGVHHGVDLRISAMLPALPGFEAIAMYTAWYDPVASRR